MYDRLNPDKLIKHKAVNLLQSIALLGGIAWVLGLVGWLFAGSAGMVLVLLLSLVSFLVSPRLSPALVLRWQGAEPVLYRSAPTTYKDLHRLARRAGLPQLPMLYYLPNRVPNAFTTGSPENSAIAVSDGLLRALNRRELNAVLAHEISHLKNNDLWMMNLSGTLGRVTGFLSLAGQVLVLLNLPLLLAAGTHISWPGILLLVLAPTLTLVLQLAFSRTREFEADRGAAELTGDPAGLAAALSKLARIQESWLARILLPWRHARQPSLLRTHPNTRERIERLRLLTERVPVRSLQVPDVIGQPGFPKRPLPLGRRPIRYYG